NDQTVEEQSFYAVPFRFHICFLSIAAALLCGSCAGVLPSLVTSVITGKSATANPAFTVLLPRFSIKILS
ncbi:MAG: hypothetical protein RR022_03495, partial [Angelakisella sp.]